MVWSATTLAYEVAAKDWERLQHEKRPLAQWESIFDQLGALDRSSQNLQLTIQAATDAATDICKKGEISLLKRPYSQLPPPTAQGLRGNNLLGQFWEAYSDAIE